MREPREQIYAVACTAMFVFGLILSLPGTVLGLPDVAQQYGLTLAARGVLISTLFVGLLIGSVFSGPLVSASGQRSVLAVSAALVAVGLPLFAVARTFPAAVAAIAAIGLASAGVNTASNALASELFPLERGRRMNGIALVVSLGGLAMPLVTALTAGRASWRVIVLGGSVVAAASAMLSMLVSLPRAAAIGRASTIALRVVRQPGFTRFAVLLMLGAGTEASMAGWTSTFLTSGGFGAEAATWALSSHWLGLIVGRVAFSARVDRAKRAAIVRAAFCGAAAIFVWVVTPVPLVRALGPFSIGLAIAVIVPTSLALAGDRYPDAAGALFGALLTLAQVGGIAVPALVGVLADRADLSAGLSVLVVNCALVAAVASRTKGAVQC